MHSTVEELVLTFESKSKPISTSTSTSNIKLIPKGNLIKQNSIEKISFQVPSSNEKSHIKSQDLNDQNYGSNYKNEPVSSSNNIFNNNSDNSNQVLKQNSSEILNDCLSHSTTHSDLKSKFSHDSNDHKKKVHAYKKTNQAENDFVNPLLDTISTLTSCSDSSDECCEVNENCEKNNRRRLIGNRFNKRRSPNYSSSDGDSISGYAGSNSLDSGYKSDSFTNATPEIPKNSITSFNTIQSIDPSIVAAANSINCMSVHDAKDHQAFKIQLSFDTLRYNNNHNNNTIKTTCKPESCYTYPGDKDKDTERYPDQDGHRISASDRYPVKITALYQEKSPNRLQVCNPTVQQRQHLLILRKSLIKALKKCENISSLTTTRGASPSVSSRSSSPASTVVKSPLNHYDSQLNTETSEIIKSKLITTTSSSSIHSITESQCSTSDLPLTLPNSDSLQFNSSPNNKSVRFNNSVKITSLNLPHKKCQINNNSSGNNSYNVNKSILKDPLCDTLKSSIENGEFKSECSLEGEIDSLLYGKTGYYSSEILTNSIDSPTSTYVTMIEGKYRAGNHHSNKQNSKKGFVKESDPLGHRSMPGTTMNNNKEFNVDLITTSDVPINAKFGTTKNLRSNYAAIKSINSITNGNYSRFPNRKSSSKSRFSQMAKCMLEILDDLKIKNTQSNNQIYHDAQLTLSKDKLNETESIDSLMKELYSLPGQKDRSDNSEVSSSSYKTFPENHIYEEIMYDCLDNQSQQLCGKFGTTTTTTTTTNKYSGTSSLKDYPLNLNEKMLALKNSRSSLRQNRFERDHGSWGRSSDRPKQRSNLYSLFSNETERRKISKSLEREYNWQNDKHPNHKHPNDNYGFEPALL